MSAPLETPGFTARHGRRNTVVPAFVLHAGETRLVRTPDLSHADAAARVLLGLDRPAEGAVALFGEDPARTPRRRLLALRRRLGYAPTDPLYLSTVPLPENVVLPLRDRLAIPEPEVHARAAALLKELGVEFQGRVLPYMATRGVRYLAGLARALLPEPELLLVAEPPPDVGAGGVERVRAALAARRARAGAATILLAATTFGPEDAPGFEPITARPRGGVA